MTERQQLPHPYGRRSRGRRTPSVRGAGSVHHRETVPTQVPSAVEAQQDTILGFPADVGDGPSTGETTVPPEPPAAGAGLLALRSPDGVAGSLLLVAGAAGGMSLFLPWVRHDGALGVSLVRRAVELAGSEPEALVDSGLLLPCVVGVGGGVLFLLGLLAFRPARTHRALGVLALSLSLAVATGIVVRVADAGWDAVPGDPGVLCAVLVAGLGVVGALKAMLTAPQFTTGPD